MINLENLRSSKTLISLNYILTLFLLIFTSSILILTSILTSPISTPLSIIIISAIAFLSFNSFNFFQISNKAVLAIFLSISILGSIATFFIQKGISIALKRVEESVMVPQSNPITGGITSILTEPASAMPLIIIILISYNLLPIIFAFSKND